MIIKCPHCDEFIFIEELNCKIFRHGIFKKNMKQINPHSNKELCDFYIKNNLIIGCGKPFELIWENEEWKPIICEYK
jgi:hypothetical protein